MKERWMIVRVVRLLDDGAPWRVIAENRFPSQEKALDWARDALKTYSELGETSFALSIFPEGVST